MRTPLLLSLFALPMSLQAKVDEYRFDQVHSQVQFQVEHLGFSFSEGEFHGIDGWFRFDPDHPAASSCEVRIAVASIDMDDAAWDKKMLTADWFDVEQYPEMWFRCTAFELDPAMRAGKLHGELTLLAVTRELVLDVRFNRAGTHKFSQAYVAGFSAQGRLKRSDFGMRKLIGDIGDEVRINLEIEGIRKADRGGSGK